MTELYPLKFVPILKQRLWGGEKLMTQLQKQSNKKDIGESWELSDVEGDCSIVANGSLKGKSLKELVKTYKEKLTGAKVYERFGDTFPLLIKYIDAKEDLSIQVHPDDALAKTHHNAFGKTEMWYVMQADKNSKLIAGFNKKVSKEEYREKLENKRLTELLNFETVSKGDVYFLPAGRIHAIGAGILLAEIQQTSDITYRVYDWDRKDSEGNYRELHTDMALDAIDYNHYDSYKTDYTEYWNTTSPIVSCPYFKTGILALQGKITADHSDKDSFVIYMCVEGSVTISYQGKSEFLNKGETILMPAWLKQFEMISPEQSKLLEIFIGN